MSETDGSTLPDVPHICTVVVRAVSAARKALIYKRMEKRVSAAGQEHLIESWGDLTGAQKKEMLQEIKECDLEQLQHLFEQSTAELAEDRGPLSPVEDVATLQVPQKVRMEWEYKGLELIAKGKLAIVLMAGGQGTRLGSSEPKGCFDVGLPSKKSLFQLQAERILKLQSLASGSITGSAYKAIRWYIMTSPFTDLKTREHFSKNDFFGLLKSQIVFFQQGSLPCLTPSGKLVLEDRSTIAKAPDGNGGIFLALSKSGCLSDMREHGVECVDCYCVDNLLAKIGDPAFVGHCWDKGVECGARVVKKNSESEKVGVFAVHSTRVQVVEYSEMKDSEARQKDAAGQFVLPWGNICMHYFTVPFLVTVSEKLQLSGKYHVARKTIPTIDRRVDVLKLELFVFDAFPYANRIALYEVNRNEQFAPVKNAEGDDSPASAKRMLLALHKKWIIDAGGKADDATFVGELSPDVSYGGEGLAPYCAEKTFKNNEDLSLDLTYLKAQL